MKALSTFMDEVEFNPVGIRQSVTPPISRAEMARRLGISYIFLWKVERGFLPWPPRRRAQFGEIVEAWKANPPADPKKRRSDFGKKHRKRRRRKLAVVVQGVPVPVPHSHGEIVGIG